MISSIFLATGQCKQHPKQEENAFDCLCPPAERQAELKGLILHLPSQGVVHDKLEPKISKQMLIR